MEDLKEKTSDLVDHATDFADTFYLLTLLKATQKAANIGSGIVLAIVLAVAGVFCLFFAALALGWWLGDVVNSRAGGFLPLMRDFIVRKLYD